MLGTLPLVSSQTPNENIFEDFFFLVCAYVRESSQTNEEVCMSMKVKGQICGSDSVLLSRESQAHTPVVMSDNR